jgi:hypothetical protein
MTTVVRVVAETIPIGMGAGGKVAGAFAGVVFSAAD